MPTSCDPRLIIQRVQPSVVITRDGGTSVIVPTPEQTLVATPVVRDSVVVPDVEQQLITTQPVARVVAFVEAGPQGPPGPPGSATAAFVAQPNAPTDTTLLWLDTDDNAPCGEGDRHMDGGNASSVYLPSQMFSGGGA